ncbi:PP2C family protein-serine/threonine phosphatase [Kineococcus sp. SYSU DK004]|uniref:PP2C family protein-serine/threonine phosphatase n=1 Tax=Kineococcus sp. SYSU DK004 TaxID=3383125 RepID=UPI003D7CC858
MALARVARAWHRLMLRTSLQRRVAVIAAAFLAVVVVFATVVVVGLLNRDQVSDDPDSWDAAVTAATDFRRDFVELHVTHQRYMVTRDLADLAERGVLQEEVDTQLSTLVDAVDDTGIEAFHEEAEAISQEVDRWSLITYGQLQAVRSGNLESIEQSQRGGPAGRQFLDTYSQIDVLAGRLDDARSRTITQAAERERNWLFLVVAVAAVAIVLVATALYLVRRWVLRPLDHLSAQMLRVGGGDLQTPVGLAGPPELAAVASSAETMRRRILDELADAVAAREALAQGQPLVAEVRDQLQAHPVPDMPGWAAAAALRPAEGLLAGDWYDVLPLRDGRYAVVVADVSGHGARAGIVAIQLKRLLEAALHLAPEPDLALAMAARVFADEAERFASCVVAVVDPDSGLVTYANAGHPEPLVVRSGAEGVRVVSQLRPTGPLLSWLHLDVPGAWTAATVPLAPGSTLVVYTDGLVEARPTGSTDELGVDRFLQALADHEELTPAVIVDEALDVARRWSGGRVRDDVTLVALQRLGSTARTDGERTRTGGVAAAGE